MARAVASKPRNAAAKRTPRAAAAKTPAPITADEFIAAVSQRVTTDVYVPELNRSVTIQNLTVGDHDELVELSTKTDDAGRGYVDQDLLHRLMVVAALVVPKLDPSTAVESVMSWDANVFARLLIETRALSHVRRDGAEAAMSRFPAAPGAG